MSERASERGRGLPTKPDESRESRALAGWVADHRRHAMWGDDWPIRTPGFIMFDIRVTEYTINM